jgi:hypothetical protein
MAKIKILQLIRHAGQEYHADEVRVVDQELAAYFCTNGWALDVSGELETGSADTSDKSLDVQAGNHGHGATLLGESDHG